MNIDALCIILNENSNPLKGILSYYNFYLNGEISKLIYQNIFSLSSKRKIVFYKNNINRIFPEKIIFFISFDNNEIRKAIFDTLQSLKIYNACIVRGDNNG